MDFVQNVFALPPNVSLGNVQKELEKQKGAFLGQAQAQPQWPLEVQERMNYLRMAMLSTAIQANLVKVYGASQDVAVFAENINQEEILQIQVSGPRTADLIEGIENDFRASHIQWRQWSIEIVGSTLTWHFKAKPTGLLFWIWTGVAFLRDQERRSFNKDISKETSMNLFSDLYTQGLSKCPGAPLSFQEWSTLAQEKKRQLATDASLPNLSYDYLYYRKLRDLQNSSDPELMFELLCRCNFYRRIDFVLPSSAAIVEQLTSETPDCQVWAASVECFALSVGARDLQEQSFQALQWATLILKLENSRCRNASICQEIFNLSKQAYRGAQLSDKNSNAHQLQDVERVVKNLPRVLLHDLLQTK